MKNFKCAAPAAVIFLLSSFSNPIAIAGEDGAPRKITGWLSEASNTAATPATEWSPEKNVLWSAMIGPNSFSSEILIDGKIFLTAEPSLLLCVDAAKGTILWKKTNDFSDLADKVEDPPALKDAGNTTPTPVSDGQFVYASFGTGIVACYDMQGERKWIKHVAGASLTYGRSASPILVGDKLLVSIGNLTALDTKTGKLLWKAETKETYGTPAKTRIGDVDVVITPTGDIVRVSDGQVLASVDVTLKYASPVVQDDVVYFMDESSMAVRLPKTATGKFEVKKLWDGSLEGEFIATPVYANGLLFCVSVPGKLFVVDVKDGKVVAEQDLPIGAHGPGKEGNPKAKVYSMTAAGKFIFINNIGGETLVIEPAKEYKEVKLNRMADGHGGTPVFDSKNFFMRSGANLFCIGEK